MSLHKNAKDPPVFFTKHFFHKHPVINPSKYKICFISKKILMCFSQNTFFTNILSLIQVSIKCVSYPKRSSCVFFTKHFFHKQAVINLSKYKICFISEKILMCFHNHPVINPSKYKNVFFTKHHVSQNHVFIHIFE